ncbi:hypothetical protein GW935_02445 [Candidatus Falkowbacteria bacterium]|nr:hypothetical protein [Candidatus Falkowbacteria bacterium]
MVEIILSSAVFAVLAAILLGSYWYGQESTVLSGRRAQAIFLAEEGLEVTRNMRDTGFASLIDGTYGLATSGGEWIFSGAQDVNDIYTRQVAVGSLDNNNKLVTSTVTWQQNLQRTGTVVLTTKLTNWLRKGVGNWALPTQTAFLNYVGSNNATKVEVSGNYAYIIFTAGTPNFVVVDISNPASPVAVGSLTLSGMPFNLFIQGNYAYIASSDNSRELQIIDVTNKVAPVLVGSYDVTGSADAYGVYVDATRAALVRASSGSREFYLIDVSNPTAPTLTNSLELGATGYEVVISGNYAYVASGNNNQELQVVNIAGGASNIVGFRDISGNTDVRTITMSGNNMLLGAGSNLYVVDVVIPTAPQLKGQVSLGGTVNDIALTTANNGTTVFTAQSNTAAEFRTVDITIPSAPTIIGTVNVSGSDVMAGVAYSLDFNTAFGASAANAQELLVFSPQ